MSLLERPQARLLLSDAEVSAAAVRACRARLEQFLRRYLPHFYRKEQRELAHVVVQGKLSTLERKTAEPIAYLAGRPRKPVQHFVGAGCWDDEAVLAELRRHVAEELADPDAVLVLDPSGFPKKGTDSCGVARQWCGRLGKVDNCQVGVFLAYVTERGCAPLDRRLYLPRAWADDRRRRRATHVPDDVQFQESWRIGLDLIERSGAGLPFGWIAADDEFGRVSALRSALRWRRLRYVLDVPCNTLIRDLASVPASGRSRPPWQHVNAWAAAQPAARWRTIRVGHGAKGPKVVRALEAWVQTKDEDGGAGPRERLVVIRTVDREPRVWYTLSNAPADVPLEKVVGVHSRRHGIEELFQASKGEIGLGHYEVRSWVGWHHHMTLSMLALWFVMREQNRVGKKNPGVNRGTNAPTLRTASPAPAARARTDRRRNQPRVTPQRRGTHLPLVRKHAPLPPTATPAGWINRLQ
jgi:SRSO17 transposase